MLKDANQLDGVPKPNPKLSKIVDDFWRSEKLPHEEVEVPLDELPDPEADSNEPQISLKDQENKWTDLGLSSFFTPEDHRASNAKTQQ